MVELVAMVDLFAPSQGSRDKFTWLDSDLFSVKSCYASPLGPLASDIAWNFIWSSNTPSKISFFGWCAGHGGVMSERKLKRREFNLASKCCMCKKAEEIDSHLLLHCPFVSKLCVRI